MKFVPVTLKEANEFVEKFHRHNKRTQGHKFSIGLKKDGELIGVAIAGRPVSRHLDDGRTLEVLRVCVRDGFPNACSKLYARVKRIGQLFGYEKVKTYTLTSESQSSLKAIRAVPEARVRPHSWNSPSRPRKDQAVYHLPKIRWELSETKK